MADQNADCHFEFTLHTPKEGHLYFQINRKHNDGNDTACYRSEINEVTNNLICFSPVDISIQALCNADKMRGLIFRLYQWKDKGETEELGCVEVYIKKQIHFIFLLFFFNFYSLFHFFIILLDKCIITSKSTSFILSK